jgi:hypothetical protein
MICMDTAKPTLKARTPDSWSACDPQRIPKGHIDKGHWHHFAYEAIKLNNQRASV